MTYILTGFTQEMGFRVFSYEGTGADKVRMKFTVRADLSLIRLYGIRIQELPLMCLGILERRDEADTERALTFTEDDMGTHSKDCLAARDAAALKRKTPRRAPTTTAPRPPGEFQPSFNSEAATVPGKTFGQNW